MGLLDFRWLNGNLFSRAAEDWEPTLQAQEVDSLALFNPGLEAAVRGDAGVAPAVLTTGKSFDAYTLLPQFNGKAQGAWWTRPGKAASVRDNKGARDWLIFGHDADGTGNALHIATSQDNGGTWNWCPYPKASALDTGLGLGNIGDGGGIEYATQDSTGNIHLTFKLPSGSPYYFRLTPTRDLYGHVTGYTGLTAGLDLSSLTGPNGGDYRASAHIVTDGTSAERLAVCVTCDGANNGQYVYISLASSLTPTALSDFKDLAGTASTMSLAYNQTAAGGGAYDHAYGLGQLGSSKDLYIFGGNVIAEPATTVATGIVYVRLTTSGSTWTVGSTLTAPVAGVGAQNGAWFGGVCGTANYVWCMYFDYQTGHPYFMRVDSSGTLTDPVASIGTPTLPTFAASVSCLGAFNVSSDETRIWGAFTRDTTTDTGGWGTFHQTGFFWDGSTWTLYTTDRANAHGIQARAQAFGYGHGGSVDPTFDGLQVVMSECVGTSFTGLLAVATVMGGTVASGAQLAAGVAAAASVQAALTTGIQLGAAVAAPASVTADLLAPKPLAAAVAAPAVAAGALTTGIPLASAVAAAGSVQAALATGIPLSAAVAGSAVATAALTTGGGAAALAVAIAGGASLAATLTTGIPLGAATAAGASVQATLTTGIPLAGAVAASAVATGALSTAIRLAAGVAGAAAVAADLTAGGGASQLQAAVAAGAVATANLTQLSAALAASVAAGGTVGATLSTGIPLGAGVSAPAGVTADLTTGVRLASSVAAGATVTAALTTQPSGLAADVAAAASAQAALSTAIRLGAAVQGSAAGTGDLSTGIRLAAAVQGGAAVTAALTTTPARLSAGVVGAAAVQASLSAAIRLSTAIQAQALVAADLSTTASAIPWAYPGVLALAGFASTPGATATPGTGPVTVEVSPS